VDQAEEQTQKNGRAQMHRSAGALAREKEPGSDQRIGSRETDRRRKSTSTGTKIELSLTDMDGMLQAGLT
jgi:hypothetical protein